LRLDAQPPATIGERGRALWAGGDADSSDFYAGEGLDGRQLSDGIDALLEFQDQFGDPTKASGRAIF